MTNTSLLHWGIPGMRWGIRRKSSASSSTPNSADHTTAKSLRGKKVSQMSNDELKKLTTRMQLEKQYKDLSTSSVSAGEKAVREILGNAGKQLASKYVVSAVENGVPKLIEILKTVKA